MGEPQFGLAASELEKEAKPPCVRKGTMELARIWGYITPLWGLYSSTCEAQIGVYSPADFEAQSMSEDIEKTSF